MQFGGGNAGLGGGMPAGMQAMQMGGLQQMGMSMGLSMGMPMGVPMGMPMMSMMGMPMGLHMGMGLMPFGMNPLMAGAAAASAIGQQQAAEQRELREQREQREQFAKALEVASNELASKTRTAALSSTGPAQLRKEETDHGFASGPPTTSTGAVALAGGGVDDPPRCHLHKKPNLKCKFCQKADTRTSSKASSTSLADADKGSRLDSSHSHGEHGRSKDDDEDYSRRTFNCSPMLKDQIYSSSYFKSLLSINTIEDLVEEIAQYADTLDVYNAGSTTSPSCFICQAYRLFTLPHAEDLGELHAVLDHTGSAVVRCVGFIYMRFVINPNHLWGKLEEYLFDDMELVYACNGKQVTTTIGEYVEQLLIRDKYFNTPLPRIPVKVRQMLEKELAPLPQYRKRMEANRKTFKANKVTDKAVEVCIDGRWVRGLAKELVGRAMTARKLRVRLDDGSDVNVHLGKVILRKGADSDSESPGEERARKRRRSQSPDWSRWKGPSEQEMLEELRERAKDEATMGHGRVYTKRPLRDDLVLATKFERGAHEQKLLDEDRAFHHKQPHHKGDPSVETEAARRRRLDEEAERAKKLRDIYEKYGAHAKPATAGYSATAPRQQMDMDAPDHLRLG